MLLALRCHHYIKSCIINEMRERDTPAKRKFSASTLLILQVMPMIIAFKSNSKLVLIIDHTVKYQTNKTLQELIVGETKRWI